jgi:hypothetical protein
VDSTSTPSLALSPDAPSGAAEGRHPAENFPDWTPRRYSLTISLYERLCAVNDAWSRAIDARRWNDERRLSEEAASLAFALELALETSPNEAASRAGSPAAAHTPKSPTIQPEAPAPASAPRANAVTGPPVDELVAALTYYDPTGKWTPAKVYRNLYRMPGAHKIDPQKSKSRWSIPDAADSARRWASGERKEQS